MDCYNHGGDISTKEIYFAVSIILQMGRFYACLRLGYIQ